MIGKAPICMKCKRYRDKDGKQGMNCDAYPNGIPIEILTGEHDHTEPYEGDHGIQFEPVEDSE